MDELKNNLFKLNHEINKNIKYDTVIDMIKKEYQKLKQDKKN